MTIPFWLKLSIFLVIFMTSVILPLLLLEPQILKLSQDLLDWTSGNLFNTSLIIIAALTADVFFPIPNGLTNTLAGATLGFSISFLVIWVGLTFGCLVGYLMGMLAARPLSKRLVGEKDLLQAEQLSNQFGILALILARPAPFFAELTTLAAGMSNMSFKTFILATSLSNLGVALVFSALGTAALKNESAAIAFIGVALLPAVCWFAFFQYTKKK
ncbi:MAG: VTT domain-containing protein [Pseudomonadota bacterium]|nr:VTT domain-containing protein [Pseudomonadota bacterium]